MTPMARPPLSLEYTLLGFLRQQPMHGYQISRQLARIDGLGLVWRVKLSLLYALLNRLEAEGLIEARREPQPSRPMRKVFHLTQEGERVFSRWLETPVMQPRAMRIEFLAKLYFARMEPPPQPGLLLERQRETCKEWLASMEAKLAVSHTEGGYPQAIWSFRKEQIQGMMRWIDQL